MQKLFILRLVPGIVAGLGLAGFGCSGPAAAAPKAAPKAASKAPHGAPATLGTHQMAGGDGELGRTYTYAAGYPISQPINLAIKSVEYAVERVNFNVGEDHFAPKADQKLVIIRYRIKNPTKSDISFQNFSLFQTVDADGVTQDVPGRMRRESGRDEAQFHLKPGQGIDDLISSTVVPAKASLTKLIVIFGRVGTHDKVTRFPLGTAPNLVQSIPAPYADPSDPTGATPLESVPAQVGTTYRAGFFDLSLDSAAYAPGPFGETSAESGKQFLVATITVTNRVWQPIDYRDGTQTLAAVLKTDDDEKTTSYIILKGKRDEVFGGDKLDPDSPRTIRLLFQIPKDAKAKSLSLAELLNYGGDYSHALVFDLSAVK